MQGKKLITGLVFALWGCGLLFGQEKAVLPTVNLASAPTPVAAVLPLYLTEFLTLLQAHPRLRQWQMDVLIARDELRQQTGIFDWVAQGDALTERRDSSVSVLQPNFGVQRRNVASVELDRKIGATGGSIGINGQSSFTRAQAFGVDIYQNKLSVNLRQPLLKDWGGSLSRLSMDLAQLKIDSVGLNTAEQSEAFALQMSDLFLDWWQAQQDINILNKRFDLAQEELRGAQKRFANNVIDEADLLRIKSSTLDVQRNLLAVQRRCLSVQRFLAHYLGMPRLLKSLPVIKNADWPAQSMVSVSWIEKTRIIQILSVAKRQIERQAKAYKQGLRPTLDAVASTGWVDEQAKHTADNLKRVEHQIGLEWRLTLGRNEAKGLVRANIHRLKQVTLQTQDTQRNLLAQASQLQVEQASLKVELALDKARVDIAEKLVKAEVLRYQAGRTEWLSVIRARDQLQLARQSEVKRHLSQMRLHLSWLSLSDALLSLVGNKPGDISHD